MKVKHWAGYGCVEARCTVRAPHVVVVEVTGDHEQGLEPRYFTNADWMRWLGRRFNVGDKLDVVEVQSRWDFVDKKDHMKVMFWR